MKKMCLVCGQDSESDAVTCPSDGEASWMPIAEPEPEPEAEPKPKKKKAVTE